MKEERGGEEIDYRKGGKKEIRMVSCGGKNCSESDQETSIDCTTLERI